MGASLVSQWYTAMIYRLQSVLSLCVSSGSLFSLAPGEMQCCFCNALCCMWVCFICSSVAVDSTHIQRQQRVGALTAVCMQGYHLTGLVCHTPSVHQMLDTHLCSFARATSTWAHFYFVVESMYVSVCEWVVTSLLKHYSSSRNSQALIASIFLWRL